MGETTAFMCDSFVVSFLFRRPTMKLIAPRAPRTALFSNLLKPEIEKHNGGKGLIVTGTQKGTTGGDVSFLSEKKNQKKNPTTNRCNRGLCVKLFINENENALP